MRIFVLLAVVLAALGAASPALAGPNPTAGSTFPHAGTGPAARLVLERSGGFAGTHDTFVVDRATAGSARVLRLAGTSRFRRLGPSYQPVNPCCDRFSYRLTASYPGHHGSAKTITTVDGAPAPQILWDVIRTTQQIGNRVPSNVDITRPMP